MTVTKNYDSEFCGKLPLHQINLIQSYGWLLVLRKSDLSILQISENAESLFNIPMNELIGMNISELADDKFIQTLKAKFDKNIIQRIPISFDLKTKDGIAKMFALIHTKRDHVIVELEKADADVSNSFIEAYEKISFVTAQLQSAKSVQEICEIGVNELKRISGFDKVMIYHFDPQWNGDVWAENGEPGMQKYIGLKFPASDVPKQARELYLKNPYRLIPDRGFTPVRLYPVINSLTGGFIDLSDCNLRGVAAVHLEYLKNMGVTASMSLRILKDEKLWGLIACHHREAKHLNFEQCSILEMISNFISERITSIENKEKFDTSSLLQTQRASLLDQMYSENDVVSGLFGNVNNLLSVFNAGGAAIVMKNEVSLIGETPGKEDVENIIYWLQSRNEKNVFNSSAFSSLYDQAEEYSEKASGIIAIPVRPEKGEFVLIFRPEVIQTVNWGGNPEEAIQFEPDKKNYHPRNSFEQWKQTLQKTALPWNEAELATAEQLRSSIFEFSTRYLLN